MNVNSCGQRETFSECVTETMRCRTATCTGVMWWKPGMFVWRSANMSFVFTVIQNLHLRRHRTGPLAGGGVYALLRLNTSRNTDNLPVSTEPAVISGKKNRHQALPAGRFGSILSFVQPITYYISFMRNRLIMSWKYLSICLCDWPTRTATTTGGKVKTSVNFNATF